MQHIKCQKPVHRFSNGSRIGEVKSLCLTKYHTMKTYHILN